MKTFDELPLDQRLNPLIAQLEKQEMQPLVVKQYSGGITEISFELDDWWNFATELFEQRLGDYEYILRHAGLRPSESNVVVAVKTSPSYGYSFQLRHWTNL